MNTLNGTPGGLLKRDISTMNFPGEPSMKKGRYGLPSPSPANQQDEGIATSTGKQDDENVDAEHDDCSGIAEYRRRMQGRVVVEAQTKKNATNTNNDDDDDDGGSDSSDYDSDASSDDSDGSPKRFGGKRGGKRGDNEFHQAQEALLDSLIYEKDEPRPDDIGKFLTRSELRQWRRDISVHYPTIYSTFTEEAFAAIYGNDGGPHGYGTKIRFDRGMAYKTTIVGSKSFFELRCHWAYYVVRDGETGELCKIELDEVHKEFKVGWADGKDKLDEGVYHLLPPEKPNNNDNDDNNEDDDDGNAENDTSGLDEVWLRAEEHHRKLQEQLKDWERVFDGPFEEMFIAHMFPENHVTLAEVRNDHTLEYRTLLLEVLFAHAREGRDAAILENHRRTKWLAIDSMGLSKVQVGDDDEESASILPVISVHFGISYERDRAEDFCNTENKKFISCSGQAMNAIQNHILKTCCGRGLNDGASGLLLFQGWVAPMKSPAPSVTKLFDTRSLVLFQTMPDDRFGVELELSCTLYTPHGQVAINIQRFAGVYARNLHDRMMRDPMYLLGFEDTEKYNDEWRIERDGSIVESPDYPNSNIFEFISPILKGEAGVQECKRVLDVLNDVTALLLNKSMGVHVHIEIVRPSLETLKSISINFLRYEDAIDTFMAESRRSGANKYCRSNLRTLMKKKDFSSKEEAIAVVQNCTCVDQLYSLMNPKGRYHKLNFQNLKTGKRPTIEFRQHSATSDSRLIEPWVRFCMAFIRNSTRLGPSSNAGRDSPTTEGGVDELFDCLIQDPELKAFYRIRREELRTAGDPPDMGVGVGLERLSKGGQKTVGN
jgi:hypothetical protein